MKPSDDDFVPGAGSAPRGLSSRDLELRDLVNFGARNVVLILGLFLAGVVGAAVFTWRATPVYESEVSVRIEDIDPISPMFSVLGGEGAIALLIETEMGVLRSRTLAEDVVDTLRLMLQLAEPRGLPRDLLLERIHVERWAPAEAFSFARVGERRFAVHAERTGTTDTVSVGDAVVTQGATFALSPAADAQQQFLVRVNTFDEAVENVRENMSVVRPDRAAAIVTVAYKSPDTLLVDDVPNLLARRYIQRRLQGQQSAAIATVRFLRVQVDSLSLELAGAEDALQAYREGEQVVSLQAEASAQVSQLARLQADRNSLDAERAALQQLLDEIDREAADDPVGRGEPSPHNRLVGFPSLLQNQATSQLLQSLSAVETERAALLRRRTMEDPDVESLTSRIEELEARLRGIATTYLQGLGNQVQALDQTLARFGGELARIPARELAVARLDRQTAVLREIYMLLQTRLKEAEIAQAAEDPSVRVLDPAKVPRMPVSPRTNVNLLMGALFGLMLGVVLAAVRDFLDRSIHTREDIEEASGGMAMLGVIPARAGLTLTKVNGRGVAGSENGSRARRRGQYQLIVLNDPNSPVAEAYRALRTSLSFTRSAESPKTVVVTSALPREGKSTTAANLAVLLAQQGSRTLLVDGDLREGALATMFAQTPRPGLAELLAGQLPLEEALRQIEVAEGTSLDLLMAGSRPPNPAELIGSSRMETLLLELEGRYDIVIVDTAPLNLVTDGAILGARAGGVLLVARAGVTHRGAVRYASDQLRRVGANVLGTVLNDVDHRRDVYYRSSYGSYQGQYRSYYGEAGKAKG